MDIADISNEAKKTKFNKKDLFAYLLKFISLLVIVFLFTTFVAQRTIVSGSSMEPTYSDGDNLIVNKLFSITGPLERFDVIVFHPYEDDSTCYIKRIIGLPGDTVSIKDNGSIYINGTLLEEDYGSETILSAGLAATEITLGEDEYFILGDNRNNSIDSRFAQIGNVTVDQIVGKVLFT